MSEQDLLAYIESLPKAKKEQMVRLYQKKKLADQENKLAGFTPNPGIQEQFFKSPARIRAMFAGNGIGKTTSLVIELLWQMLDMHPHRDTANTHHVWVIVPSHGKVEDYWNEIKKWCPPSSLPDVDKMGTSHIRRLRWKTGKLTTFFSHEQDSSQFEGSNISGLFLDEPCPRSIWVASYRGLRANPDYFVAIAATPISEPWLHQEIYTPWFTGKDPNIACFTGSSYENKHIPKDWIDDFSKRLSPEEREVRIEGKFANLQGLVYGNFRKETHVIDTQEWPENWPVYACIDPHVRKPHAALWVGITPDQNYVVLDELKVAGTIVDLAREMKTINEKYPDLQAIYIDTKGVEADWSRSSAVDILGKHGIYCTSVGKQSKDLLSGINRIKALLVGRFDAKSGELVPQLKVMAHCTNIISEFGLYVWQENKHSEKQGIAEKPRKVNDDLLDCLRYLAAKNLSGLVDLEVRSAFNGVGYNKDYNHERR